MPETSMDGVQPALCHAHCQSDQQSADTYQLPDVPVMPEAAMTRSKRGGSVSVPVSSMINVSTLRKFSMTAASRNSTS